MAETVRIEITAVDRTGSVFSGIQRRAKALHATFDQLKGALAAFNRAAAGAGGGVGRLSSAVFGLAGRVFGIFGGALRMITGLIGSLTGAVFRAATAIGGRLVGAFSSVINIATGAKLSILGLITSFVLLARQGINVNTSMEMTEMALRNLLKSGPAAKSFLGEIRQMAKTSAFEFVDLADMAKRMLAFGFERKQVLPYLTTIGDVAFGMGGGKEMMNRLMIAFGQMRAKGTISGEEAMQLMEAGVNVRELLGVPFGKDIGEMKIPSAEGIPKIIAGLRETFGGQQAGSMGTLPGQASTLKDVFDELSKSLTKGLYASLKRAQGALVQFLDTLNKTREGKVILDTLKRGFDAVGRAIEWLAGRLPVAVKLLADLLQSERFERFKQFAVNAFHTVWRAVQDVLGWIGENWQRVWEGAKRIAVGTFREVGGFVAGFIGMLRDLISQQKGVSDGFSRMAKAVQVWANNSIISMTLLIEQWAQYAIVAGSVAAIIGLISGNAQLVLIGAAQVAHSKWLTAEDESGQSRIRRAGFAAGRMVQGLQVPDMEKLGQEVPLVGSFMRHRQEFLSSFDKTLANMDANWQRRWDAASNARELGLTNKGQPYGSGAATGQAPAYPAPASTRAKRGGGGTLDSGGPLAKEAWSSTRGVPLSRPAMPIQGREDAEKRLGDLDAQIAYLKQAAEMNPAWRSRATPMLDRLWRAKAALLRQMPYTSQREYWQQAQGVLETRGEWQAWMDAGKPAAPSAAPTPTMPATVADPWRGFFGGGGAAGAPGLPTPGSMAGTGQAAGGRTIVINLPPAANPDMIADQVRGIVREELWSQYSRSYGR